ncbi:carbohydrate ABC transporter permease [Nesterenkonia xinjiangensis]|uniref:Multiple sugar transport system permease protein/N,N'-diacetylchitobiose transport system permease protein n=1 Tax=Nesterenkonia xinjiangensis TaxID=225327 RepID=A0A7Z0K863_9MICC|nr:sugar ABC transporter permease [Nesterenkonia xinjiangensis]NYJ77269.1 multiple sugar transport system permease protein/N,N'-diacetylchitobiose transport system permease protein [Nesterenkonia xinjiangensis]
MSRREYWILILPSLLVMFGLLLVPMYRTVEWSLKDVNYGEPGTFVGLDNYMLALTDPRFAASVVFTVGLTLIVMLVVIVLGYILAVLVNNLGRMRPLVLGILLISYVIPNVVGATMFSWLFDTNFGGVANLILGWFGQDDLLWFTDRWPNRIMIALNVIWAMLPFSMLILLAGLQGVPQEIIEAAKIDGAGTLGKHFHVILPSIRGMVGFVAIISIMDVLRVFDNLIPLAPNAILNGNESIALYTYNMAFQDGGQQLGLGSVINVLTIVIMLIMLIPFLRNTIKEARSL